MDLSHIKGEQISQVLDFTLGKRLTFNKFLIITIRSIKTI